MQAFTDYPFTWLGDKPYELAPIREIKILSYDRDEYCKILVAGEVDTIKYEYIYLSYGRYHEVSSITKNILMTLPENFVENNEFYKEQIRQLRIRLLTYLKQINAAQDKQQNMYKKFYCSR